MGDDTQNEDVSRWYSREAANDCARRFCPWPCCNTFFMRYETAKVVKIEDCRIRSMYIFLLVLVAGYAVFNVIGGNQYCEFVTLGAVNLDQTFWWDVSGWAAAVAPGKENLRRINDSNVPYCNGTLNTDFWFGSGWQYINNTCGFDLKSNHFTSKLATGLRATTSMGVFNDDEVQTHVVIVPEVEALMMTYGLVINVRTIQESPELYLERDGDYQKMIACDEDIGLTTGCVDNSDYIYFTLQQLLMFTGVQMDDRNSGLDDQRAADTPPDLNSTWPTYRLTGSTIKFEIDVSNYMFAEKIQFIPGFLEFPKFDDKLKARMKISGDKTDGKMTWSCVGWTMVEYSVSDDSGVGSYYTCDMRVLFSVGGSICFTSAKAIQDAIIAVAVLFGFAGILVDIIFTNLLKTFEIAKASDDKAEWMTYQKAQKYDATKLAKKISANKSLGIQDSVALDDYQSDLPEKLSLTKRKSSQSKRKEKKDMPKEELVADSKRKGGSRLPEVDEDSTEWLGGENPHDIEAPPEKKKKLSKKAEKWKKHIELSAKSPPSGPTYKRKSRRRTA